MQEFLAKVRNQFRSRTLANWIAEIPAEPSSTAWRHALVEILRVHLALSWKAGKRLLIEDYRKQFSQFRSLDNELPHLLQAELDARRSANQLVNAEEYYARFPQQRAFIDALFEAARPAANTSIRAAPADATGTRDVKPSDSVFPAKLGRYRIVRLLGKGGMGAVYLAEDTQLERKVALKLPNEKVLSHDSSMERFMREAKASALLNHPNICPIFDVGEHEGMPFLTMAYVEGKPLSELIDSGMQLAVAKTLTCITKIAWALDHAHRSGILHRDLKPSNILIRPDDEPVVMDFGLAKRLDASEATLTHHGAVLGTPAYMSPEQAEGNHDTLGPTSDVFSLGVILYEMLAGRRPFDGPLHAVIHQIIAVTADPLESIRPNLSSRLIAACDRALAKQPGERFASMADFARELEAVLAQPAETEPTGKLPLVEIEVVAPPATETARSMGKSTEVPTKQGLATQLGQITDSVPTFRPKAATTKVGDSMFALDEDNLVESPKPIGKKAKVVSRSPIYFLLRVGALGIVAVVLGAIWWNRIPKEGSVSIQILNAPASATIKLNDQTTTLAAVEAIRTLPSGTHKLVITGPTLQTLERTFTADPTTPAEVRLEIRSKPVPAVVNLPPARPTDPVQPPVPPSVVEVNKKEPKPNRTNLPIDPTTRLVISEEIIQFETEWNEETRTETKYVGKVSLEEENNIRKAGDRIATNYLSADPLDLDLVKKYLPRHQRCYERESEMQMGVYAKKVADSLAIDRYADVDRKKRYAEFAKYLPDKQSWSLVVPFDELSKDEMDQALAEIAKCEEKGIGSLRADDRKLLLRAGAAQYLRSRLEGAPVLATVSPPRSSPPIGSTQWGNSVFNDFTWRQTKATESDAQLAHFIRETEADTKARKKAIANGLKWLQRSQAADGQWINEGLPKTKGLTPHKIAPTCFGVLPFLGQGYTHRPSPTNPYDRNVAKAITYLISKQDKKTGKLGGNMYEHGIATMALCEAYGLTKDAAFKKPAQHAVNFIIAGQAPDGGWRYSGINDPAGDTSISGWQVAALKSAMMADLDVPMTVIRRTISFFEANQSVDGGFGYMSRDARSTTTAIGLVSMMQLTTQPPSELAFRARVRKFLFSDNKDWQMATSSSYHLYYATQAAFAAQADLWPTWNQYFRDLLLRKQENNEKDRYHGSWSPAKDQYYASGGRLMVTGLALLVLEHPIRCAPFHLRDQPVLGKNPE